MVVFLALATGFRFGLRFWVAAGVNSGSERLMMLGGGILVLICTGFAAAQAALGLLALLRQQNKL